jgi:hypothetical protein
MNGHITASGNISASGNNHVFGGTTFIGAGSTTNEMEATDVLGIGSDGNSTIKLYSTHTGTNRDIGIHMSASAGGQEYSIGLARATDAFYIAPSKAGLGPENAVFLMDAVGNITSSGGITASGNIHGDTYTIDANKGLATRHGSGQLTLGNDEDKLILNSNGQVLTTAITASGISSSSDLHCSNLQVSSKRIAYENNDLTFLDTGLNVAGGSITGSNISASGTIIANSIVGGDIDGGHITINSSTISDNSDLTLDAGGDITLDTEEDIIFKEDGTTRYIFRMDSTPEIDIVGDLIIDPSGGDVKFSGANINVEGHITASGNISASGTITADDGSGKQFTVRPNLYFFATNTSATTQTLHGSNAGDQEGSLPATNTTTITLSQQQNSHSSVFSLSSNRLTISRAGLYKFTYNAVIEINNGSGRAEGFCGLVQETSAGDVTLVNGSEARGYHRFKHDQGPSGVTFAATVIVNVAANSIYDLRFGQEDQSVAGAQLRTLPSGTAITVEAIT